MNLNEVAFIFRRNMTALVADAAERRRAASRDAAVGRPSRPDRKHAA